MTHIYIKPIEQPTLHYLTRSVRRRAATSKRANRKSSLARLTLPATQLLRHLVGVLVHRSLRCSRTIALILGPCVFLSERVNPEIKSCATFVDEVKRSW